MTVFAQQKVSYQIEQLIHLIGDAIEYLNLDGLLKKRNQRIMLKLNVAGPFSVEKAATTNPEVVRAMIRLIREAGSVPILGDAPNSRLPCFEIAGLLQLAKEENVEIINFKKFIKVKKVNSITESDIEYSEDVLEADKLISMAKLKTHALTHYTGAVKNMFGAVSAQQRKVMHLDEDTSVFVNSLIDVYMVRRADFSITDGIVGMEGMGPTHGNPVSLGILACSENAFTLDALCAKIIGYDLQKLPFFIEAEKRGLINLNQEIKTIGNISKHSIPHVKLVPVFDESKKKRYLSMALGSPFFDYEKCISCRQCARSCPAKAIRWVEGKPVVYGQRCIHCYCCNELCPVGAVSFKTRKLVVQ
jgi:uncharacterized protein (DUF362 family)/NAD-dependent dihydropyrimidine dehydrogenase PreA subunit